MAVQQVTDADFEAEVLKSKLPVVVDFYADWCGPCKTVAPVLEELSTKLAGKVRFVKVDVERNPYVAAAFRVQSIPMFAFIADGKVAHVEVGALDRNAFEQIIGQLFPNKPGAVETWDPMRVKLAIEAGVAVAVDLRAASDHARLRLPGAVSAPADDFATYLPELALERGARLVLYNRNGEGVAPLADQLAATGAPTVILEGGLFAWELASLPVERGARS
jgi:thioredoxin 1